MRKTIEFIKFNLINNYTLINFLSTKTFKILFFICLIVSIVLIGFFITEKNYFYGIIFYPDKTNSKLIYERRAIPKAKDRKKRLDNIVSELLLGPLSPKIKNFFSRDAKLINSWLENEIYHINLTEETFMTVDWKINNNISIYEIIIKSIVDSICINDRKIKKVKFYFNNKEYNYIGNIKISDGLAPDWKILLK